MAFNAVAKNTTDNYSTPPYATELIIKWLPKNWRIWECCSGEGMMSNTLKSNGYDVLCTDILNGFNALLDQPEHFDC